MKSTRTRWGTCMLRSTRRIPLDEQFEKKEGID